MASSKVSSFICAGCRGLVRAQNQRSASATTTGRRSQGRRYASTSFKPSEDRPFRLGIIGSGPAGFYAAARVIQKRENAIVDMYEKLPVPFGLVRYGVAPDHPEVKNCQDKFNEVASSPRFNFIGNVQVGVDLPLSAMKPHYDALLFAYGASADRKFGNPSESTLGVYSARAFVGWYNGLPEYSEQKPDLQSDDTAIVLGNGNVALDVARILLTDLSVLRKTDISERAVQALSKSRVRHVRVIGRRGPMQAAFTIKEVRELLSLPGVAFHPIDPDLLPKADYISALPRLEQRKYRLSQLLAKGSETPLPEGSKSWALDFLKYPLQFTSSSSNNGRLGSITFGRNAYANPNDRFDPSASIVGTGDTETIPARLAFRAIGYRAFPLHCLRSDLDVPFDEGKGIILNDGHGRVLRSDTELLPFPDKYVRGCYCAGWVKRGPTGVIASTMEDAFESADTVMRDWEDGVKFLNGSTKSVSKGTGQGWDGVAQDIVGAADVRRVSWQDWLKIDRAEIERGKVLGKPREKFRSREEMLAVLDG